MKELNKSKKEGNSLALSRNEQPAVLGDKVG